MQLLTLLVLSADRKDGFPDLYSTQISTRELFHILLILEPEKGTPFGWSIP